MVGNLWIDLLHIKVARMNQSWLANQPTWRWSDGGEPLVGSATIISSFATWGEDRVYYRRGPIHFQDIPAIDSASRFKMASPTMASNSGSEWSNKSPKNVVGQWWCQGSLFCYLPQRSTSREDFWLRDLICSGKFQNRCKLGVWDQFLPKIQTTGLNKWKKASLGLFPLGSVARNSLGMRTAFISHTAPFNNLLTALLTLYFKLFNN